MRELKENVTMEMSWEVTTPALIPTERERRAKPLRGVYSSNPYIERKTS